MFTGLLIENDEQGYRCNPTELAMAGLPDGDVLVDVAFSSLNYKDALAITGQGRVVREFPMVPGIDFVGRVNTSSHSDFTNGQWVILNGWGVGETHWGGLATQARVKGDWLVPLPEPFSPEQAMAIGTAGYTAMLCVLALERQGITPSDGSVLVTGAAGGVGSIAVSLLSHLGYRVIASSGRETESDYLQRLGAAEILPRSVLTEPGKPLMKERWCAAVDVVGSQVLANVCAGTQYGGVVTACGLAGGMDLPATVAPFILRGVSLLGIDSVMCPKAKRLEAWQRLARDLAINQLDEMTRIIGLSEVQQVASNMLAGKVRGRVVVDVHR